MGSQRGQSEFAKLVEDLKPELRRAQVVCRWWWRKPAIQLLILEMTAIVIGILLKEGMLSGFGTREYRFGDTNLSDYAAVIWMVLLVAPVCWVWRKPAIRWINRSTR